jgi:hypothetical protein
MKKSILLGLFAAAALLLAIIPAFSSLAAPAAKPFVGGWEAVDVDGSYMKLSISGGGKDIYNVHYIDFGASVCGKDENGQPIYSFQAKGDGVVTGYHMDVHYPAAYCMTSPKQLWGSLDGWFDYDPATDTLWDGWVTWRRTGAQ